MIINYHQKLNSATKFTTLVVYIIYYLCFKNNSKGKIALLSFTVINTLLIVYLLFHYILGKKIASSNTHIFRNISNFLLNVALIMFLIEDL